MSQQEFVPPASQSHEQETLSGGQGTANDDEIYYPHYPYSWSGKPDQEAVPRDEPPVGASPASSELAERVPIPSRSGSIDRPKPEGEGWGSISSSGDDGDAYEQGYRLYNATSAGLAGESTQRTQGVPPWARPQQHRRGPFTFGFILLILLGIALIQGIVTNSGSFVGALGATGDILGAIVQAVLFFIVFVIILLFIVLGLFMRLLRPRRARYFRRGPFWW